MIFSVEASINIDKYIHLKVSLFVKRCHLHYYRKGVKNILMSSDF